MVKPPGSILILKPSSFGDVIHTLPAVARLKQAWPTSRISWLVNPEWRPLLEGNPDLERIIPFPRNEFHGLQGWFKFCRWCHQVLSPLKPDLALDFQGLLRSALMGRASGAKVLLGLNDAREGAAWFYRHTIDIPAGIPHAVERYLTLANDLLERAKNPEKKDLEGSLTFPLPTGQPLETHTALLPREFILLHPFARGQAKSLSVQQVTEFCQWLAPRQVVIVGRSEKETVDAFPGALNLLDQTSLVQLVWLMRRAAFVISVDSGPAHLAAALGKPMVAIHTWSDPRRVGPYHPTAWIWKNGQLFQKREMIGMDDSSFRGPSIGLAEADIARISALATSPSYFSA